jgi:TolA-binding protein
VTDPEDLSARARRRELDDAELRHLRRTLEGSLEARLLHRAGTDFDAGDTVRRGDDELAQRIVARVVATRQMSPRRRARAAWLLAVAALCAGTAAAAGGPLVQFVRSIIATRTDERASNPLGASSVSAVTPQSAHPAPGVAGEALPEKAAAAEPRATNADTARGTAPRIAPAAPASAATLFAAANLARREGQTARAIDVYEELQRRYPDAPESRAVDISLGMLRLDSGSAGSALRHFERYLRAPSAELTPEALWGKSQALARLGRIDEARETWRFIVSRHPGSAYAKAASAKLAAP